MPEIRNPWASSHAAQPPPPKAPRRATHWLTWAGAAAIAIGAPAEIAEELGLLFSTERATARVIAAEEPGGAPGDLPVQLPMAPANTRMERGGLRFATVQGQEVTFAAPRVPMPWRTFRPGEELTVRYDPANPAARPVIRSDWEIWATIILAVLAAWILLPGLIRVARGAPRSRRTTWPPWPFRRR